MNYLDKLKTFNTTGTYKEVIKAEYFKFRNDSLSNAIFRCFVFEPDKDLKEISKRRKHLGSYYSFKELDLMKKISFKHLAMELQTDNFINKQLKPKTKQEYYLARYALNNEINNLIVQSRAGTNRHYGLRLYQIPDYYLNGQPINKWVLVPTDTRAIELVKNHPAYCKELILEFEHRASIMKKRAGGLSDKLKTFEKTMEGVVKEIKYIERKERWS